MGISACSKLAKIAVVCLVEHSFACKVACLEIALGATVASEVQNLLELELEWVFFLYLSELLQLIVDSRLMVDKQSTELLESVVVV